MPTLGGDRLCARHRRRHDRRRARRPAPGAGSPMRTLVRQEVDPGLAEVSRDNLFRTRVFPILPRRAAHHPAHASSPRSIPAAAMSCRSTGRRRDRPAAASSIDAGGQRPGSASSGRSPTAGRARRSGVHRFTLALGRGAPRWRAALPFPCRERAGALHRVSRHANGERFFELTDEAPAATGRPRRPRSVAMLWDRSLSRADDDSTPRSPCSGLIWSGAAAGRIELDPVRRQPASSGSRRERRRARRPAVAAVRYRGAIELRRARRSSRSRRHLPAVQRRAGDDRPPRRLPARLPALRRVERARRRSRLARRARRGRGGEALRSRRPPPGRGARPADPARCRACWTVRTAGGAPHRLTPCSTAPRVAGGSSGRCPTSGGIVVRLSGRPGGETRARLCRAARRPPSATAPARSGRPSGSPCSRRATSAAATRWSLSPAAIRSPAPDISFIVLENRRRLCPRRRSSRPPASRPTRAPSLRAVSAEQLARQEESAARRPARDRARRAWQEQKPGGTCDSTPRPAARRQRRGGGDRVAQPRRRWCPPPPGADAEPAQERSSRGALGIGRAGSADDRAARGRRADRARAPTSPAPCVGSRPAGPPRPPSGDEPAARGTIALEPWPPTGPICRRWTPPRPAELERGTSPSSRREHGALPAFWLDVADWHFRAGPPRRGAAPPPLRPRPADPQQPDAGDRRRTAGALRRARPRHLSSTNGWPRRGPDRPQPLRTPGAGAREAGRGGLAASRRRADLARASSLS